MPTMHDLDDVTPGTTGSWQTVTLSGGVTIPDGSVGVTLLFVNTNTGSSYPIGARHYSSTQSFTNNLYANAQSQMTVGVDGSKRCGVYIGSADVYVYLVASYSSDEAVFFTDKVEYTGSNEYAWTTIDVTADVGADAGSVAAIFLEKNATSGPAGWREYGSSDTSFALAQASHLTFIHPVDSSDRMDAYGVGPTGTDSSPMWLTGYMKANVIWIAEPYTKLTPFSSGGTYQDLAPLPVGAVAGIYDIRTTSALSYALRSTAEETLDPYRDCEGGGNPNAGSAIVKCNPSTRIVEGKSESIVDGDMRIRLLGYMTDYAPQVGYANLIEAVATGSAASITSGSFSFTAGNRVIVVVGMYSTTDTSTTMSDSATGSTWAKIAGSSVDDAGGTGTSYALFECKSIASTASATLTCNFSSANNGRMIAGIEFSGINTSAAVQDFDNAYQTTPGLTVDIITTPAMTPTSQPAVVFGFGQDNNSNPYLTGGTGFTSYFCSTIGSTFNGTRNVVEWKRITTTDNVAATFSDTTYGDVHNYLTIGAIIREPASSIIGNAIPGESQTNMVDFARGLRVTTTEASSAGITGYAYIKDTESDDTFQMALISDADKQTVLAYSGTVTGVSGTQSYVSFTGGTFDTFSLAAGTTYIVTILTQGGNNLLLGYAAETSDCWEVGGVATLGTPPSISSALNAGIANRNFSIYLEYMPASSTPDLTLSWSGITPTHRALLVR